MEVNVQRDYQPQFILVQPLHTEMADKGAFTVYTATFTKFLACCKDSAKSCSYIPVEEQSKYFYPQDIISELKLVKTLILGFFFASRH